MKHGVMFSILDTTEGDFGKGMFSAAMNCIYYAAFYALTALFSDRDRVFKKYPPGDP